MSEHEGNETDAGVWWIIGLVVLFLVLILSGYAASAAVEAML